MALMRKPRRRPKRYPLAQCLRNEVCWPASRHFQRENVQPPEKPPQQTWEPGSLVARVLEQRQECDRLRVLAFMEQCARQEGKLAELRETRAYKAKHKLL